MCKAQFQINWDLNEISDILKLLMQKKAEVQVQLIDRDKGFLMETPVAWEIRAMIDKWNLVNS